MPFLFIVALVVGYGFSDRARRTLKGWVGSPTNPREGLAGGPDVDSLEDALGFKMPKFADDSTREQLAAAAVLMFGFVLSTAVVLGVYAGVFEFMGRFQLVPSPAADEGGSASSIVATIAFVIVAGYLALAVHEVGHAIGGRIHGMRRAILSFAAGGPVTSIVVGVLVFAIYVRTNLGVAYAGDVASARSRLEGAGKSALLAFDPTARTRTEGAVLLAEGDAGVTHLIQPSPDVTPSGRPG